MTVKNEKDTKKKQDRKKIIRKKHLTKVIQQIGINGILYPRGFGIKHYYTQEIMILAEQQGLTQSETAKILGVSQSMISQWLNGEPVGLADIDTLQPLIALLTPRLPGDKFEVINHVTKIMKSTPSNWEEDMIINHCQNVLNKEYLDEYGTELPTKYQTLTREDLDESHLKSIEDMFQKHKLEITDTYVKKIKNTESQYIYFNELVSDYDNEIEENHINSTANQEERREYRKELVSVGGLDERQIEVILNKNYPVPVTSSIAAKELASESERLKKEFNLEHDITNINASSIFDKEIQRIKQELENELSVIDVQYSNDLKECKTFGLFDSEYVQKEFTVPSLSNTSPDDLYDIANKLYGDETRSIEIQVHNHMTFSRSDYTCRIVLDFKAIYIEYINSLCSNYNFQMSEDHICYLESFELPQIKKDHDEDNLIHTNALDEEYGDVKDTSFKIYQLYSNDLLLVISTTRVLLEKSEYSYDLEEIESTSLNFIHRCNSADSCISQVKTFLTDCKFESIDINETVKSTTEYLIKSGYRFNSISAIY